MNTSFRESTICSCSLASPCFWRYKACVVTPAHHQVQVLTCTPLTAPQRPAECTGGNVPAQQFFTDNRESLHYHPRLNSTIRINISLKKDHRKHIIFTSQILHTEASDLQWLTGTSQYNRLCIRLDINKNEVTCGWEPCEQPYLRSRLSEGLHTRYLHYD